MLEAYSLNVAVSANSNVPFNSTSLQKGCTVTRTAPDTFVLNKCGVYMVSVDASAAASTTYSFTKMVLLRNRHRAQVLILAS